MKILVKIPVAVDSTGEVSAGCARVGDAAVKPTDWYVDDMDYGEARYIVTVELEVPDPVIVEGHVEEVKQ